jgi:uroporphyrinogen-III synthase
MTSQQRNGVGVKWQPLQGRRIVVTRAPHQAGELAGLLTGRGADTLLYPCIDIAPPQDTGCLDIALQNAAQGKFDWLILTSVNTVRILAERLAALKLDADVLATLATVAVGPATAQAAREKLGMTVHSLPEQYESRGLVKLIHPIAGRRILLPQADIASCELRQALEASGGYVTTITAYRTVIGSGGVDLPRLLAQGAVDAITFTSPSTVHYLVKRLRNVGGDSHHLRGVVMACIGPTTLKAADDCGFDTAIAPNRYTLDDLVQTLEDYFS